MSARVHLRAATAEAHERVDRLFSGFALSDPVGYARFLSAQAAAHLPSEAAIDRQAVTALIPDWPERRRAALLIADLAELGRSIPPPLPAPALDSPAALLGAAYVLEGSRLGGAYLKRAVPNGLPLRFLSAPQPRGGWRTLLMLLDRHLAHAEQAARAIESAIAVFALFERAVLQHAQQQPA